MQLYTPEFGGKNLTKQTGEIAIGKKHYRAEIDGQGGRIRERGPEGEKTYPIAHVMGGKNVYYFLTPLDHGRLQVLPLAYDVHKKAWYDMAASGVRHFPVAPHDAPRDAALDWTDRMFAFNSTCFNCHVTELATNYDLATRTYHTTWSEPGISCESCHGSAKEHVRVMNAQTPGQTTKDIAIIRTKEFTAAQMNDMCATCHAKIVPLSLTFLPSDKFFDHFDLVTLEHADYYPDGRDLGENYTFTSWLMSPCAQSGKLDCNHCHTPSGRLRFSGDKSNQMCMPCHEQVVKNATEHGHHKSGSKGNECVACHMPMTRFAAMGRTDHSMLPPTPTATIAFQSPNACGMCHADHDARWADEWVRKWYPHDYQAEVVRRAGLIDQARKRQWKRLPEMLAELKKKGNEVYKASLIRLLGSCDDGSKWPVLLEMLHDPSPLVRASAATALGGHMTPEVVKALRASAADSSRLVRIRVAMSLAPLPPEAIENERDRMNLENANAEFITAMQARPDDWSSYGNLGNFYMERRDFSAAAQCFETATSLEPRQIGPMVNASMAYSNLGYGDMAEKCLRAALKNDPSSAAANFNLGLLFGEQGRLPEAERALRAALKTDPQMAAAAFNLGVILGEKNLDEAIVWCQKAHELRTTDPKYTHTLAFYQRKQGKLDAAVALLRKAIENEPSYVDAYLLLGEIYEEQHDLSAAANVYRDASQISRLPPEIRSQLKSRAKKLEPRSGK